MAHFNPGLLTRIIAPAIAALLLLIESPNATPTPRELHFRDISGVNQAAPAPGTLWTNAVSWDRVDLPWSSYEPEPNQWQQNYLHDWGNRVIALRNSHVRVLPILGYNTTWSWSHHERTFSQGSFRWNVSPMPNGRFRVTTFKRTPSGNWIPLHSNIQDGSKFWPLSRNHVEDWEAYVRRVVSLLHRPPYNIQYFQIWNEAYPTSGFWFGNMRSYFTRVLLPAADIIHKLGAKVVYGGWPAVAPLPEYVNLINKYHAWNSIDVLDVHYFPLTAFPYLAAKAANEGHKSPAIWETELGFTRNPEFIANQYPRLLFWAISHDGTSSSRYILFYFANWSPNSPRAYGYGRTLYSGDRLTRQGVALYTLGRLFGSHRINIYTAIKSHPHLTHTLDDGKSSLEGFSIPGQIIATVHLQSSTPSASTVTLTLPNIQIRDVTRVARWNIFGRSTLLTPLIHQNSNGGVSITIPATTIPKTPIGDSRGESRQRIHTFYIIFHLKP